MRALTLAATPAGGAAPTPGPCRPEHGALARDAQE
jgi:hypothetical protein